MRPILKIILLTLVLAALLTIPPARTSIENLVPPGTRIVVQVFDPPRSLHKILGSRISQVIRETVPEVQAAIQTNAGSDEAAGLLPLAGLVRRAHLLYGRYIIGDQTKDTGVLILDLGFPARAASLLSARGEQTAYQGHRLHRLTSEITAAHLGAYVVMGSEPLLQRIVDLWDGNRERLKSKDTAFLFKTASRKADASLLVLSPEPFEEALSGLPVPISLHGLFNAEAFEGAVLDAFLTPAGLNIEGVVINRPDQYFVNLGPSPEGTFSLPAVLPLDELKTILDLRLSDPSLLADFLIGGDESQGPAAALIRRFQKTMMSGLLSNLEETALLRLGDGRGAAALQVDDPEEITRFITTLNRMQQRPGQPEPKPNVVMMGEKAFHYRFRGNQMFISSDPALSAELASWEPEESTEPGSRLPSLDMGGNLLLLVRPGSSGEDSRASKLFEALNEKAIAGLTLSSPNQHTFIKAQAPFENPQDPKKFRGIIIVRIIRSVLKAVFLLVTALVIASLVRTARAWRRVRKAKAG